MRKKPVKKLFETHINRIMPDGMKYEQTDKILFDGKEELPEDIIIFVAIVCGNFFGIAFVCFILWIIGLVFSF